ncbi:MAG: hypothetical protein ABJZ74_18875 [Nitratireductor sp.]
MGRVVIKIPLVTWRDGRPRFFPGEATRLLGYRGEDLRHADGRWFTLEEAIAWSVARQADIVARRAEIEAGRGRRAVAASVGRARQGDLLTVGQLVETWQAEPRFQGREVVEGRRRRQALSANTVRFYKTCAAALERHRAGRVWNEAAGALTVKALDAILERIEVDHGLAMTRGVRAMLSAAYAFGLKKGLVTTNPAAGVRLPVPAARIRAGEPEEIAALVDAADRIGRPDIGDAIMLGVWTGQRQGDRLSLSGGQVLDDGILFRQAKKHGQPLLLPAAPVLTARLEAARLRRRDWRVNYPHVVLDEANRRPFAADWYRKVFRVVREIAATGRDPGTKDSQAVLRTVDLAAALAGFKPVASLADLRDQDLRDTAVTWLARAGCDLFQIASITGHELASIQSILKHYLGLHPELARTAIGKLVAWMEAQA